jgi:hypothetical protein
MDRSPANGFPIGPTCGGTDPEDPEDPPPPGTATLQGIVYEGTNTSARIAGATVSLGAGLTATTSPTGLYVFSSIAPGTYTIAVTAPGFNATTATRTVAAGADNWGSVSMTRGGQTGSLVGVIYRGTDTTQRIANAQVQLATGQSTTADASGVYRFTSVTAGSVGITASASGFTTKTITRTITAATENWGSIGLASSATPNLAESECGAVTFEGECDANVVSYCDDGELHTVDCAAAGQTCGWNAQQSYFDCL